MLRTFDHPSASRPGSRVYFLGARAIMLILSLSFLSSCGFQLRGGTTFSNTIAQLDVQCLGDEWRLCQRVKTQLIQQGILLDKDARLTLQIERVKSKNRVLTITQDASVADYDLEHQVTYTLIDNTQDRSIRTQTLRSSRQYEHDNKALLSQEKQIDELDISLQHQLADMILNQLSLVRVQDLPPPPTSY